MKTKSDNRFMTGRPSVFTPEIAAEICERIAMDESLIKICESDHMPSTNTVYRWLNDDDKQGFRVRRDGTPSALIIWNMNCVDCGERVEIKTGMKAKGITKRCAAHRKKGKPATEAAMARMTAGRPCHRENEKR